MRDRVHLRSPHLLLQTLLSLHLSSEPELSDELPTRRALCVLLQWALVASLCISISMLLQQLHPPYIRVRHMGHVKLFFSHMSMQC